VNCDNTQVADLDSIAKLEIKIEISYQNTPAQAIENDVQDTDLSDRDALFDEAARLVVIHQQGSTSLLQRKLKLGYNRTGRLIDQLEAAGIVGPFEGSKGREVLIKDELALEELLNHINGGPDNFHSTSRQEYSNENQNGEGTGYNKTNLHENEGSTKEIKDGFFRNLFKSIFNI
jgi:hypothetical protein